MGGGITLGKYSTTEQVVGTWINNKPIYQIVIADSKISGTNFTTTIAQSGIIDEVWVHDGYLKTTAGVVYSLNRFEYASEKLYTRTEIENKTQFIFKSSEGDYANGNFVAIIWYTKVAD